MISHALGGYPLRMRKRAAIIVIAAAAVLSVSAAAFLFSRPSVAFVTSGLLPEGYELPQPGNILEYRMTDNLQSADLVITAPDAALPEGVPSYLFGRKAEEGESPLAVLDIDEGEMWECAITEDGRYAALYEETSSAAKAAADHLRSLGADVTDVTYTGRISGANLDQVSSAISDAAAAAVLALTPSSSTELLRSEHSWRIIMDARDAAALESTACDDEVAIDWDATIRSLLSGNAELSYRLVSL